MVVGRSAVDQHGLEFICTGELGLGDDRPWLIGSLVHKFGGVSRKTARDENDGGEAGDVAGFVEAIRKALPPGFQARGRLHVWTNATAPRAIALAKSPIEW